MGTVPIGTGDAAMMASRVSSSAVPVERSITVSAPYFTANCSFSSSPSMSDVTAELPMFALILTLLTLPTAIGLSEPARWNMLAGMTSRPRATSLRTSSGLNCSRSATNLMASVMTPSRAKRICVLLFIGLTPYAGANRIRFYGFTLSRRRTCRRHPGL